MSNDPSYTAGAESYGTSSPMGGYGGPVQNVPGGARPSVSFGQAIKLAYKNLGNFSGRASRSEFWWVYLFVVIVNVVLGLVLGGIIGATTASSLETGAEPSAGLGIGMSLVYLVMLVFTLVTMLALWVRRLHDVNQPGLWLLLGLIGLGIVPLIMAILESNPAGARFDDPSKPLAGPENL